MPSLSAWARIKLSDLVRPRIREWCNGSPPFTGCSHGDSHLFLLWATATSCFYTETMAECKKAGHSSCSAAAAEVCATQIMLACGESEKYHASITCLHGWLLMCNHTHKKPPQSWISPVLWQAEGGILYPCRDLNFLSSPLSLADKLKKRKTTSELCFCSVRLRGALQHRKCWRARHFKHSRALDDTGCQVFSLRPNYPQNSLRLSSCRREQWFAVVACRAAHSAERRMRSTLRLYSQQLASYHLAQDSESSLGPPCLWGRASGVSFSVTQDWKRAIVVRAFVRSSRWEQCEEYILTIRGVYCFGLDQDSSELRLTEACTSTQHPPAPPHWCYREFKASIWPHNVQNPLNRLLVLMLRPVSVAC